MPARQDRREGGRASRLGDDAKLVPKRLLRSADMSILEKHDFFDMTLRQREHVRADLSRAERIGGDAVHVDVHRTTGIECPRQRGSELWLHADDARPSSKPG